jgi:hypothetical protein
MSQSKNALIQLNDLAMKHGFQVNTTFSIAISPIASTHHQPLFTCRLQVDEMVTREHTGRSKQEAKRTAAIELLELLQRHHNRQKPYFSVPIDPFLFWNGSAHKVSVTMGGETRVVSVSCDRISYHYRPPPPLPATNQTTI